MAYSNAKLGRSGAKLGKNQPTSFRLSELGKHLLERLADREGLSMAGWLELTVRDEARRLNILTHTDTV